MDAELNSDIERLDAVGGEDEDPLIRLHDARRTDGNLVELRG